MTFGERLYELRYDKRISQAKLANVISMNQGTISSYEKGEIQPTAPVIIALAKYFGVSSDYLLGLED